MAGHSTGGWTSAGGGLYVNMFTGDNMGSSDFMQNTPYLTSSEYVDYSPGAVTKVREGLKDIEFLDGTGPYGSKMAIFTYPSGKVSGGVVPFWEITGSYYNELYYYSGLVAFDTYAAKASMSANALFKYGISPVAMLLSTISGSKFTPSSSIRSGYWRGANGQYYPMSLTQNGTKGWVFYRGSANIAKNSVQNIRFVGSGLGYLSLAYNGVSFYNNPSLSTGIDFSISLASTLMWEVAPLYGAFSLMKYASSGERNQIQENIHKNRDPLYNVWVPGVYY